MPISDIIFALDDCFLPETRWSAFGVGAANARRLNALNSKKIKCMYYECEERGIKGILPFLALVFAFKSKKQRQIRILPKGARSGEGEADV